MADPICRWRNSSIKQLMEFNSLLPLKTTSKKEGREHVEGLWKILGGEDFFTTPYQLAVQMGTYYEDDDLLYPRFEKLLSIKEASLYMHHWGVNYYSPNPYTKSIRGVKPVVINKFLVNYAQTAYNPSFRDALQEMFGDNVIGNTDILKNMLNNFSEVNIEGDIVTVKPNAKGKSYSEDEIYPSVDVNDKKTFFEHFGRIDCSKPIIFDSNLPLQQIYYGAPGTGKSHSINKLTKGQSVIRTTFHPDSDYSTFVGAYKPTTLDIPVTTIIGTKAAVVEDVDGKPMMESKIVYEFVEQAFLKAYIKAWKNFIFYNEQLQYLIIEEINRGNCAQIFGDLFQLLDRNSSGFSVYPIHTDSDMRKQLRKAFARTDEPEKQIFMQDADKQRINQLYDGRDVISEVLSGEVLLLPNNLHIWATMNTSDQSLFPIDSAFKRRWDWKYVPIKYDNKDWKVELEDGCWCKWIELQQTLNNLIYDATESEDKMLGDWFVKADNKNKISQEALVGKIIFYLWNDVAKIDAGRLFDLEVEKFGRKRKVIFSDFYKTEGNTNTDIVKVWLTMIGITINEPVTEGKEEENSGRDESATAGTFLKVIFEGEEIEGENSREVWINTLKRFGIKECFEAEAKNNGYTIIKDVRPEHSQDLEEIDGYWVWCSIKNNSKKRAIEYLAKKLGKNVEVEII